MEHVAISSASQPESAKPIRVFISSPGDVQDERERARQVIEGLRRRYSPNISLKHIFWEDLPLQPDMSFQQGIDLVLTNGKGADIAVFILWSRLGSPLGPSILKPDKSEYLSGTEREFHFMMEARRQSGGNLTIENGNRRPDILIYRRHDDSSFSERLRGKSAQEQDKLMHQRTLVETFFESQFKDAATGHNLGAYHSYDRPVTFSQRLRTHLIEVLDRITGSAEQGAIWDTGEQGPPFVGLEAFQPRHADVFFGREEETLEARRALNEQARNGCAFLMLSGASGSGKSSIVQAGLLPSIVENELDDQVAAWLTLIVSPFQLSPHPITALVSRMAADEVLPELQGDGIAAGFADRLARNPVQACPVQLKSALDQAARRKGGPVRLLLVIDQLEEFFASAAISPADRSLFFEVLEAMARSGSVWIAATVRSDFYQEVQKEPSLVRMKAGSGQLDILPPGADALRRLVVEPAHRAGLRYETLSDGQNLADRILGDAAEHTELLPLIEDLLRELYERRNGNQLTFAAYNDLGGSVESALALRAEGVFNRLPEDAKTSLGAILQALVTHGYDSEAPSLADLGLAASAEERVVRQWAALGNFPAGSAPRSLIDAFVRERLFTVGRHPETGAAGVTVAHESLLWVWPRAVHWARDNHDFLRTRAQVARRMKEGSPLLEADPLLGTAKDHLARNQAGFVEDLREFITSSVQAAEIARKNAEAARIRRQRQIYIGVFGALLLIIGSIAYFSYERAQDALAGQLVAEAKTSQSQRDFARAEISAAKALTIRDTPETRQLLLAARTGGVRLVSSSADEAPQSKLSIMSRDGGVVAAIIPDAAGTHATISIRSTSTGTEMWRIDLPPGAGLPDTMALSEHNGNARQIAISWPEVSGSAPAVFHAGIWNLEDGKPAGRFRELLMEGSDLGRHAKRVPAIAFDPSNPWVATGGEDGKLCLWDYSGEKPLLIWEQEETHEPNVHGIAFNKDGSLLASGGGDYLVKTWRTAEMAKNYDPKIAYVPHKIEPALTLTGHNDSVFAVAFRPDSNRIASGGYDRTIRIWDLTLTDKDGKQLPRTVATLSGHAGTVFALSYSEDGNLLTSGASDETVRLWDANEGRHLISVTPFSGPVRSVASLNFGDGLHVGGEQGWSIWSVGGDSLVTRLWNGGATIGVIAFDPTGQYMAAGGAGNSGKIRVWDRSYHLIQELDPQFPDETTNGIAFSADGRWLAAGGDAKVIHVWDRANGWKQVQPAGADAFHHEGNIWGLCFDPKGRWLASSNESPGVRIKRWNLADWSLKDETEELKDSVYALACDMQGKRLVAGDSRARVAVRDAEHLDRTITATTNVTRGELNVWSVAITASPLSVLSGNSDGRVWRWIPNDAAWTGSDKKENKTSTSAEDAKVNPTINSVSYNQRRGWTAAGGVGPSVEIYDEDLRKIQSLRGHDGTVWYVQFDPQGSRLAYGGLDRILRVFDIDEMERELNTETPAELYRESQRTTGLAAEVLQSKTIVERRNR